MDRFAFSDEEKEAIEFKMQVLNGNEAAVWNAEKSLPYLGFDLDDGEMAQVVTAVSRARILPGPMRRWLEPILAQLPEPDDGARSTGGRNG